jgi:Asp-tRNA(Asn)/Glu-tRNA(Gln) amidotransferase A subunit family amidase
VNTTPDSRAGKGLHEHTALELRELLASGQVDLQAFYEQHIAFTHAVQERLEPFAALDDRVVRLQAEHRLAERARGEPLGRLYGVPVGVKDIIDTIDFPTAFGSPIHAGRYAVSDATVVRRLRDAGAVICGKTVTTEFATMTPGPTRNPHDPGRTPGGSSSGSAAAVAAGVMPVALGTQTNGSVLRPASFCGVYGFKPSRGLLPRTGVFEQSPTLDQVGVFARSIEDLALVAEIASGDDGHDPSTRGQPPRQLLSMARAEPPVEPRFCFVRTPWWDRVDPEAQEAFDAFVELMEGVVVRAELPPIVQETAGWLGCVNEAELTFALQRELRHHPAQLSAGLRERVERGAGISALDYLTAKDRVPHVAGAFDGYFEHYDAILCPAALGAAPQGLGHTGDPIMQTVWSFAGLPAVSLPLLWLEGGLPLGVQAVGASHNDGRLLRACRWLVNQFVRRGQA